MSERRGPLAGVKVLDLSRMLPGAYCTLLLADLGADVVKVESPGAGDGIRSMPAPDGFNATHTALNRGKRSLVVDLRHPEALSILARLVRDADVVVESFRPGQLERLGLGYDAMKSANPQLIWCSLTGFGVVGSNRDAPGHDLTFLGYSGLLTRLADGPVTPPSTVISLPLAALMGCVGILGAMADVSRTGKGARVDANMVDSAMWVLSEDIARAATAPSPGWGTFASRNVYVCGDGRAVTVAASEPRTWSTLCAALGTPEFEGHRIGVEPEEPVMARLAEVFRGKTAGYWIAHPGLRGGVGPVNEASDLIGDVQLTDRHSLVALPGSGAQVLANPIRYDGARGDDASFALAEPPALGADTDEVLTTAGFTIGEVDDLRSRGVVG